MTTDTLSPSDALWKNRFTRLMERLPKGQEIEIERLVVRVKPPSIREMADEVFKRAAEGTLSAVYRVFSPRTHIPLKDFPFDGLLPAEIEDDTTGETVQVDHRAQNIEIIVRGTRRDDE